MIPIMSLSLLPPEIHALIAKYLEPYDLGSLVRTSGALKRAYTFFLYEYATHFSDGSLPLIWASQRSHIPLVSYLLSLGHFIDCPEAQTQRTALAIAACNGGLQMVRFLVSRGAALNCTDNAGYTPLIWAVIGGHMAICRVLLGAGADPNLYRLSNQFMYRAKPALHWAALGRGSGSSPSLVSLLLKWGADVNAVNADGRTALIEALTAPGQHAAEICQLLVASGAEVNFRLLAATEPFDRILEVGQTALFAAAANPQLYKILIDGGADAELEDAEGETVLEKAVQRGFSRHVLTILSHGAKFNIETARGTTLLKTAMARNHQMVDLLVWYEAST